MTEQFIMQIIKDAFYYIIIIVGPLLLVSLIVGLIISIFQAATSISEQTLTFVPKLLAVFVLIVLLLPYMLNAIKTFTIQMFKYIEGM